MKSIKDFELPKDLQQVLSNAKKLEWITVIYLISVVIVMYLTMGSSQAMKSAWLEDVLSLVPSIAFLISTKINTKKANNKFRYGYHRVFSISFLAGAVALLGMGLFLVYDSSMALIHAEHPTIGTTMIFGHKIWMGWIMLAALIYSAVPAMVLGFKKLPLSKKLHNKLLHTDASAQKADYMTALAAIVGVLAVGAGFWWADAVAALFISFSVLKDGISHTKTAALDLMDRHPVKIDSTEKDEITDKIKLAVSKWTWVKDVEIRFREAGQIYFGEIVVVPSKNYTLENIEEGYEKIRKIHWKIYDFSIIPVKKLPDWE